MALVHEGDPRAPAAANIPLDAPGTRVMLRWVAAEDGTAHRMLLRVKVEGAACDPGGRDGYAAGSGGVLEAVTYPVDPATGLPDEGVALARGRVAPCRSHSREGVAVPLGMRVTAGEEYATVVRNVHARPSANWASLNLLYADAGSAGPHARDERAPGRSWWTGLDAREVVGFDRGDGRFRVPGGPYGQDEGRIFIPTYLVDYGHRWAGQPFYWALPARGLAVGRLPAAPRDRRVTHVAVLLSGQGSGVVEVRAGGRRLGRVRVSGTGAARAPLGIILPAGQEIEVRARVGSRRLPVPVLFADPSWSRLTTSGLPRAAGHRGGALPIRLQGPGAMPVR